MSDEKKMKSEIPSCVTFGLRYWKRLCSKFDRVGFDWMSSKVQKDWFLACHAYELLKGMVDDDGEHCYNYNYKLFFLLGYQLIDLVSSVNFALDNNFNKDKEN